MNAASFRLLRPESLLLTSRIIPDHGVRGVQDDLRGTVILLQLDHARLRIHFFKIKYIADIGTAELIDRLIVIAHHAQITVLIRQQSDQFKLRRVGILILVYHNIAEPVLIALKHLCIRFKKLHRLHDQIVEIERVIFVQNRLILLVCPGNPAAVIVIPVL